MKLAVPFYSQRAADITEEWHHNACGIVSLRMALEGKGVRTIQSTMELINKGVALGAFHSDIGWKHDGLIALAEAHGVAARRSEFGLRRLPRKIRFLFAPVADFFAYSGMHALRESLDAGVIPIVSLTTDTADTHLVTLTGYDRGRESGFYYHDPAGEEADNANRFMDSAAFAKRWRQLAIFVG